MLTKNKISLIITGLLFLFSSMASAQLHCGESEQMERIRTEDPERYAQYVEDKAKFEETLTQNGISFQKASSTYIIPIVFHIIHNNGPEKLAEEQVLHAIRILNEDFNGLSPDTGKINPIFWPVYADISVEFRLAKLDPSGNCSDGINYYESETHSTGGSDATWGWVQNQWTPNWRYDKYLNIYTNKNLGGYYGWTYGATTDVFSGVMVAYNSVGKNGNYNERTLSHEIGHWFNLIHTWGHGTAGAAASCNGDDQVDDTPNCRGTYGCHNNLNSCDDGPDDLPDNTQNFMDYGCGIMFTEGQKTRMHASLNGNVHDNLWSPSNLIAAGVQDPYDFSLVSCGFDAVNIEIESQMACTDEPFTFGYDVDGAVTDSVKWSFAGGTPSTSVEESPTVTYSTPGKFVANLVVYSGLFVDSTSVEISVQDLGNGYAYPFSTSFQDSADFADDFSVFNYDNDEYLWERITLKGYDDSFSARLLNNNSSANTQDELLAPLVDLSGVVDTAYISFKIAYSHLQGKNDLLEVYFTKTCGDAWHKFYTKQGAELKTMTSSIPASESDWREEVIELPVGYRVNDVQYKFRFTSSGGNHIWIDDINYSITGIEKNKVIERSLSIFPNPLNSTSVISFDLPSTEQNVTVEIYDYLGKQISNKSYGKLSKGNHQLSVGQELLSKPGIYVINVRFDNEVVTKKVVVK